MLYRVLTAQDRSGNFSRQITGDKECPFNGTTNYKTVVTHSESHVTERDECAREQRIVLYNNDQQLLWQKQSTTIMAKK